MIEILKTLTQKILDKVLPQIEMPDPLPPDVDVTIPRQNFFKRRHGSEEPDSAS